MGIGVDVDPVELRAAADALEGSARELSKRVDAHMRAVREFVGGEWVGAAAGSHEGPWAEWERGTRRIIESFRADAGLLRRTAGEFEAHDRSWASAVHSAGASLDLPGAVSLG
ncbi:WXG100 family type VII secretion target [Nocardia sp. NPDC052001]|uniref:WXG100 family type VII secretion target n=1 Tax=Nocardia sp. NPDC052001 TaxID=3154853 RepID=UPI00342572E3